VVTPRALLRDADSGRWLRYDEPVDLLMAATPDDVPRVLEEAERRAGRERLHAVGFVTYEAASGFDAALTTRPPGILPPAWFALFRAGSPATLAAQAANAVPPFNWQPDLSSKDYLSTVRRIREYIAAGDTYQVNFTYRLRSAFDHCDADLPQHLFTAMAASQGAGYGALLETDAWAICCASPELFFTRHGRRLTCRPMKGTASRGADEQGDANRARWLYHSAKNRAENLMITDMVRNDIGRLADPGSVRTTDLFKLEDYPTVWQMTSSVCGDTDASVARIFRALFPAASITGAPKRRTMQIIQEFEQSPRDIYTGALGFIHPNGDAQFNVSIRTALLDKARGQAHYGVGGGIVWDSDPLEELEETRTKSHILRPAPSSLPGQAAAVSPAATANGDDFALLETLLWEPGGGFLLLDQHLQRLGRSAAYFGRRIHWQAVHVGLENLARDLGDEPHRVRLLVGPGPEVQVTASVLSASSAPARVALTPNAVAVLGNPFISHKTTRRQIYESARQETQALMPEAEDVLLVNERGEVTESTIANLVVDLDGVLVTPPLSSGLLAGVYRQYLLDSGIVRERVLQPQHVRNARAIYLANSVRRLWPVTLLED
jgi:para-aminobenzoate synthetase / 4-amino-4-deoxychorismate lyase